MLTVVRLLAVIVLALVGWSVPGQAEPARQVTWEDLMPANVKALDAEATALQETVSALPPDESEAFRQIAWIRAVRADLADGVITEDDLEAEGRAMLANDPTAAHPHAAQLYDQVEALRDRLVTMYRTPNETLNGQPVRLAGYVLPTEFDGTKVSEFMLVPYVGACIHVPPPPPNQIVYVTAKEPFENEGLYAPVWVTGKLAVADDTHNLFLVDGEAPVTSGYALTAAAVEPYKP